MNKNIFAAAFFLFASTNALAQTTTCSSPSSAITTGPATTATIVLSDTESISDLDIALDISHTRVGDLIVSLTHQDTNTVVFIMDRPGIPGSPLGCLTDNVEAVFDDASPTPVEGACAQIPPGIGGTVKPEDPLSEFNGEQVAGTWRVSVIDMAAGDDGTLDEWCLTIATGNNPPELSAVGTQIGFPGGAISTALSATDADDDTLTFSATGLPDFCSFFNLGGGAAIFECFVAPGDEGVYPVTITVTDDQLPPASDSETFDLIAASACVSPSVSIPDNNPGGVASNILLAGGDPLSDLDVVIEATHTWVGDLKFELEHVDSGTTAALIDRPGTMAGGGCDQDDITVVLDDDAPTPVEGECSTTPPALGGVQFPNDMLAAFNGELRGGTWRLTATDLASGDTGTLARWCLSTETASNAAPELDLIGTQTILVSPPALFQIPLAATDADGDELTFGAANLPFFCGLTDGGPGDDTATIDCSVGGTEFGSYTITVTVTDGGSPQESDFETFDMIVELDTDADGVRDIDDSCLATPNAGDIDADGDGYGNACDGDFNNDCIVNPSDLGILRSLFFSSNALADLNNDGVVNPQDLGIFRTLFFATPGPSGLTSVCD